MDIKFLCPHCSQHLEGPAELAGLEVNCPACSNAFVVSAPPKASETARIDLNGHGGDRGAGKRHWVVDLRVLVTKAPPVYLQTLVEVPNAWTLPTDAQLPAEASEVIRRAVSARFPRSPVTTTRIHMAQNGVLKRISEHTDFTNESCRVWMLGRAAASL